MTTYILHTRTMSNTYNIASRHLVFAYCRCTVCWHTTGKSLTMPSSKHAVRWLRIMPWSNMMLTGSKPLSSDVAYAMAYRPQALPPSCFATLQIRKSTDVLENLRKVVINFEQRSLGHCWRLQYTLTWFAGQPIVLIVNQWLFTESCTHCTMSTLALSNDPRPESPCHAGLLVWEIADAAVFVLHWRGGRRSMTVTTLNAADHCRTAADHSATLSVLLQQSLQDIGLRWKQAPLVHGETCQWRCAPLWQLVNSASTSSCIATHFTAI